MSNRWIQAATIMPPTVKVCGYRLLPFCLRHRVALEAINSPVMRIGSMVSPLDVIKACRILCTHKVADMAKPMSFMEGFNLSRMRISTSFFKRECGKLLAYFEEQSLWPRFWEDEKNKSASCVPWQLSVVATLVRNGHTSEESWTMPEAQAIWLQVAHGRACGAKIEVVTDEEWKAMEEFKKSQTKQPNNNNG